MDLQTATQLPLAADNLIAAIGTVKDWIDWGFFIMMLTIAVASFNFWRKAIARLIQGQELIPYHRSECVLGFIDFAAIFAAWIGSQLAVGVALVIAAGSDAVGDDLLTKHGVLLLYLSAASSIALLSVSAAFLIIRYRTTNSFGLRTNQLAKQIGHGIVVFTMLFPPMLLVQHLLSMLVEYDHPVLSVLSDDPSFVSIFSCWAAAVLSAPFVEEFLFRGVFQHWLERLSISKLSDNSLLIGGPNIADSNISVGENGLLDHQSIPTAELVESYDAKPYTTATDSSNPYQSPYAEAVRKPVNVEISTGRRFAYWPILVSSTCFAAVHIGQGLAPIPLFILALGLGYLFRQTGSLIACITVHFLLNFYSMLVFTIMILLGETP